MWWLCLLGWELVNADKSLGIIEATETTAWFGFKDDVVVRIRTTGEESFLDVRSKSRVGKSDLGKNAERIHTVSYTHLTLPTIYSV